MRTTIADFLEARLAEDEHGATHVGVLPVPEATYDQRTLLEVAAKRRILRRFRDAPIGDVAPLLDDVRDLASVFEHHRDYDLAWRPLAGSPEIDLRPGTQVGLPARAARAPSA